MMRFLGAAGLALSLMLPAAPASARFSYTMHACQFYPSGGKRTPAEVASCRHQHRQAGNVLRLCRDPAFRGPRPCGPNQAAVWTARRWAAANRLAPAPGDARCQPAAADVDGKCTIRQRLRCAFARVVSGVPARAADHADRSEATGRIEASDIDRRNNVSDLRPPGSSARAASIRLWTARRLPSRRSHPIPEPRSLSSSTSRTPARFPMPGSSAAVRRAAQHRTSSPRVRQSRSWKPGAKEAAKEAAKQEAAKLAAGQIR